MKSFTTSKQQWQSHNFDSDFIVETPNEENQLSVGAFLFLEPKTNIIEEDTIRVRETKW